MKGSKTAVLLMLIGIGSIGCATVKNNGKVASSVQCNFTNAANRSHSGDSGNIVSAPTSEFAGIAEHTVNILNDQIRNKIMPLDAFTTVSDTGLMLVSMRLANCTDFPQQIEGRTHFIDANQSASEPISGWTRLYLPPRSIATYRVSAISESSRSYIIDIREGD